MEYGYLLTLCVVLLFSKGFSMCSKKMHIPEVVGALIAGVALGPILGLVEPSSFLKQLAEMGVIVLMFCAGMETNIEDLKKSGKVSFFIALMGVIVPLITGSVLMYFFSPSGKMLEWIFLGTIFTATSISITVATLKEMGKLSTKVGNTIVASAIIDDILGLICLTVVLGIGKGEMNLIAVLGKIVLFFIFSVVIGAIYNYLFDHCIYKTDKYALHRYTISGFVLCLFMSWSAIVIFGVSDIIGAFVAGIIVTTAKDSEYINEKINVLSYLLLSPIFFANIGIGIEMPEITSHMMLFIIMVIIFGLLSKFVGCGMVARICGFTRKESIEIGVGMICRGEVAIIVANEGLRLGLLTKEYFGCIIIFVIVSSVITPILLKIAFKNINDKNKKAEITA